MASFVNANLGSDSDSDDQDYDPTGSAEVVSEEDGSGDNEENGSTTGHKKKKKKQKKGLALLGKRSGGLLIDEADRDREEERKKEFENEKIEMKQEVEKKQIDDLWADFKKDVQPKATTAKPKPVGSSLGSWSSIANSKTTKKPPTIPPKKTPKDIFSSIFDNIDTTKAEDKAPVVEPPRSIISSIFEAKKSSCDLPENKDVSQKKSEVDEDKVTITKVFDFAGESVEVTKLVSKDSKEAQRFLKEEATPSSGSGSQPSTSSQKRPQGLSSIMGIISGKKPKLGTLDKSKMDWNTFVEKEGIKEELQTHNKGKDGYVEKQMFLERADHRRFEIEKQAREKTRKTLNR